MNVNAANEDMLSASELKKLPGGGEGARGREDGGRLLMNWKTAEVNRLISVVMFCLHLQ